MNIAYENTKHLIEQSDLGFLLKVHEEPLKEGTKGTVKATIPHGQSEELMTNFGIDVKAMVQNAIANEVIQSLLKSFRNSFAEAEESLTLKKYLIASGRVGSTFQDDPQFEAEPLKDSISNSFVYRIGKLGKTEIYVDPSISWSQTHCLTFEDNSLVNFSVENVEEEDQNTVKFEYLYRIEKFKPYVWNTPEKQLDKAGDLDKPLI